MCIDGLLQLMLIRNILLRWTARYEYTVSTIWWWGSKAYDFIGFSYENSISLPEGLVSQGHYACFRLGSWQPYRCTCFFSVGSGDVLLRLCVWMPDKLEVHDDVVCHKCVEKVRCFTITLRPENFLEGTLLFSGKIETHIRNMKLQLHVRKVYY